MRIFIVTPFLPYAGVGHAGGKIIFDYIKALSERHDIFLLSRAEPKEFKHLEEIKSYCKDIRILKFSKPSEKNPFQAFFIIISYILLGLKANRMIKKNKFNIIQVEYIETGLMIKRSSSTPMVIEVHDVISKVANRRYLNAKGFWQKNINFLWWKAMKCLENYILSKFDKIFVLSKKDHDTLLNINRSFNISIIYPPVGLSINTISINVPKELLTLLFVGDLSRDLNVQTIDYFYKSIFPLIKKEIPEVKFYIVGNNPQKKIKSIAQEDNSVIVTGYVDKVELYFSKCSVFVSPLLVGGGIIMKNINAMAAGLPVVTTTIGNEGILAVPDRDILIADEPKDFAKKVIMLLKDKEKYNEISQNGKKFVIERYSIENTINKLENSYKELVEKKCL